MNQKSQIKNYSQNELVDLIVSEITKTINPNKFSDPKNSKIIPLGVSNRHIHLTHETFHKLFGVNAEFEVLKPLYQPGEFASKQTLTIVGSKQRAIQNVRILGPLRKYDQVEVSFTDSRILGINPPVTNSGSLDDAVPLTLVGPKGSVYIEKCAIIANRHIHMTNKDADVLNVKNGDYCKVRVGGIKGTIFENVLIRINDAWKLQIHLDTDDANAALISGDAFVEFLGKM